MSNSERAELDLRSALRILRERLVVIVLPVVLLTGIQLALALRATPVYSARADLLLQPKSTDSLGSGVANANAAGNTYLPERVLATEIRVLESEAIATSAAKALGYAASASGGGNGSDDIMTVTAQDTDPKRAADIANEFAKAYITFRREQSVKDLTDAAAELQQKMDSYQAEIDQVSAELADPVNSVEPTASALISKRDGLIKQQQAYQARIDGLNLDASLKTGGASVLTAAQAPSGPISPRPMRSAALGFVLGLMLGLGLAFLLDFLDDKVRVKADLVGAAPGRPVLGLIPQLQRSRREQRADQSNAAALPAEADEAYRALRTAIRFIGADRTIRTLQVTSSKSGEGKTTTVVNLARSLSQNGLRVIVIDGDMRNPHIHEFLGIPNNAGLSSVLAGSIGIGSAVVQVDGLDGLVVLPAGPIPPNPAELLGSARAREVLAAVLDHYDMVIIDGPPVLPVTDPVVLSQLVDATLVVARSGATKLDEVRRTMETLDQANAPVIGFVLNSLPRRTGRYGYRKGRYGYGYGYGESRANAKPRIKVAPAVTRPVRVVDESPIWAGPGGDTRAPRPAAAVAASDAQGAGPGAGAGAGVPRPAPTGQVTVAERLRTGRPRSSGNGRHAAPEPDHGTD